MLGSAGRTAANALAAADRFGYPVVLKGTSPAVKHKSELSLVALSIADAESLRRAWTQMTDKVGRLDPAVAQDVEMIVQPMAGRGIEIILGARHEPGFGTLVTVGLGGIFVEILNSASSRIGPVDESQALRMLDECGALAICKGVRGRPPGDVAAAVSAIVSFSRLACALAGRYRAYGSFADVAERLPT
ncbi:MAG: hypothetical protein F9K19_04490 [Rhizobiaceae bacterium]|nr:MAG: hypothetical protein F9K19_04490 [Rhizobiaceae bacterium]CAG0960371.1 Trans-feruloyl-CoA synthase FCS1 [Rhizobiaceae bacterium]